VRITYTSHFFRSRRFDVLTRWIWYSGPWLTR
jgi:hypothetical protein